MTTLATTLGLSAADAPAAPAAAAAAAARRARRYARIALAACLLVHVFLVSAGTFAFWPQHTARNQMLARAFMAGQLDLLVKPHPKLLALPDPYDPVANSHWRQRKGVPDSCLYNGKLYLYWGPVPALLTIPAVAAFGDDDVGDQYLPFAFVQGMLVATALILLRARRTFFPASPAWLPALGVAVMALSAPVACSITRLAVYETAIVGGQCFLLTAIYLAWVGTDRAILSGLRLQSAAYLAGAGTCLALAVGCRVSLAVAVAAVAAMAVGRLVWPVGRDRLRSAIVPVLAISLPLVAGAVALGWYNHARFGKWSEFGQKYQLAGANLRSYPSLFGPENVLPGLWSYLLRPVATTERFPFLLPVTGENTFPSFVHPSPYYESFEGITGIVWVMPFLWVVASAVARRCGRRPTGHVGRALPAVAASNGGASNGGQCPPYSGPAPAWLHATLAVAALLAFAPVLLMIGSSQRYLVDLTPPLVIAATMVFAGRSDPTRAAARPARRSAAFAVATAAFSAVVGVLLSVEGPAAQFSTYNPDLFNRLCPGGLPAPRLMQPIVPHLAPAAAPAAAPSPVASNPS